MSFPAYPEYKDSGVPWLGEVPSHWIISKVKHTYKFSTGWTPPSGRDEYYGGDHLWANISDVGDRFISDTAKRISDLAVSECNMLPTPEASLLFSFKLSIGQMSFTTVPMYTNEAIASFRPDHTYSLAFAYYAFPIYIVANATENIYGAKILNQELIKSAPICLPPKAEQSAIASFLDRETAKIDALVAEEERLIALLKEKRQAVISHAVTKGLNPNAPMKDSGIEWLGEIPAHWEFAQLKRCIDLATSGPRGWSDLAAEEGSFFFQSQNIGRDMEADFGAGKRIEAPEGPDADRARLQPDDVAVCITGGRTGAVAHISALSEEAYINQHVCLIRPTATQISGRYLAYGLFGLPGQEQLALAMYGLKQGLSLENVREVVLPLPPLEEQRDIVMHLDQQAGGFWQLVTEAQSAIILLQERRAALISAAVTGKIDVRGLVDMAAELEMA